MAFVQPMEMQSTTSPLRFINTWIKQKNYPEIVVTLYVNKTKNTTTVNFDQSRFLLSEYQIDDNQAFISPYEYAYKQTTLVFVFLILSHGFYLLVTSGRCTCSAKQATPQPRSIRTSKTKTWLSISFWIPSQVRVGKSRLVYLITLEVVVDQGKIELDGLLTWIKCNKDFNGYYVTDYSNEIFENLALVLKLQPEVGHFWSSKIECKSIFLFIFTKRNSTLLIEPICCMSPISLPSWVLRPMQRRRYFPRIWM